MIQINGLAANQINQSALSRAERAILQALQESPIVYHYDSLNALLFELRMRSHIVAAARKLYQSNAGFATFKNTRGNNNYWTRTEQGGLRQNEGVLTSDAINDIFENGELYAFECATAMVIIFYKAFLDTVGPDVFNAYFRHLLLYDWQYDNNLRLISVNNHNQAIPGDIFYFKNPEHDPQTPEWQGENAIMLAENQFFGHGIGIKTAEQMIEELNSRRIPGSQVSAYLTDEVVYPDFEYLRSLRQPIIARIGARFIYLR
ncbi:protein-glutamine gamma-glutamyltransferase [Paenibacillus sp. GCM10027626]|uniref:protein-glutamine gamma-glutamyltransferase n=1 Tax=Paenibacillus sp. GCM10027626 TaxID=3273411 RepID=UPI00362F881B